MKLYVTQYDLNGINSSHVDPLNSPQTRHPYWIRSIKTDRHAMRAYMYVPLLYTVHVVNLIRVGLTKTSDSLGKERLYF